MYISDTGEMCKPQEMIDILKTWGFPHLSASLGVEEGGDGVFLQAFVSSLICDSIESWSESVQKSAHTPGLTPFIFFFKDGTLRTPVLPKCDSELRISGCRNSCGGRKPVVARFSLRRSS